MGLFKRKPKLLTPEQVEEVNTKNFFYCILPGTIKFLTDHYIIGDSYRCAWAIREYPPTTEEQAILSQLADRSGVTLRIYHRLVESMEQRKIIQLRTRKNKLMSGGDDVNDTIQAEGNLQDVVEMLANLRKNKEPLLHCAVFLELKAKNLDALKELQGEILMELTRSKISVDRLTLRQKEGFLSVLPIGSNQFGAQFERVLPASSAANLFPFNYSGKTDPQGMYIGRDKFGSNVLVDFDRRTADCVGFIKGYGWLNAETHQVEYGTNGMLDVSADQMYRNAKEKGLSSTMPEIPGLAVWRKGHIGIYIGNGEVIEAMGTKYGVVKTKFSARRWTHWLKIPYISYIEESQEEG